MTPGDTLMQDTPYGFCHCGCGEKTKLAEQTRADRGWIKGEPKRFVVGHQSRSSPLEYVVADRGYGTLCWIWQRSKDRLGYGCGNGAAAHIVVYRREVGPVPAGLELDHLCRVPSCVNPAHLEPVSHRENLRRGAQTKLTVEQVRELRATPARYGDRAVWADKFGVSLATITEARSGNRVWRDI